MDRNNNGATRSLESGLSGRRCRVTIKKSRSLDRFKSHAGPEIKLPEVSEYMADEAAEPGEPTCHSYSALDRYEDMRVLRAAFNRVRKRL